MSDARIECDYEGGDYLTAAVDEDGDVVLRAYNDHSQRVAVMPSNEAVRAFARKLLAFVGDEADDAAEVKVGDFVEITKFREYERAHVGRQGRVTDIDDDSIPYRIDLGDGGFVWVMDVRKVAPAAPTTRTALLDEARRLAGTGATPADVLAYAKFLSE